MGVLVRVTAITRIVNSGPVAGYRSPRCRVGLRRTARHPTERMPFMRIRSLGLCLPAVALLIGCGGGGDGTPTPTELGGTPPVQTPPVQTPPVTPPPPPPPVTTVPEAGTFVKRTVTVN